MKYIYLAMFVFSGILPAHVNAFELPGTSTQCVVGTAEDWNNSNVTLSLYEKKSGNWKLINKPWNGRLGKSGLSWGKGIHPLPPGVPIKQEGDNRSPAGIFYIGGAWGYASAIRKNPALPYRKVTPRDLWVEDPTSAKYNCNVILNHEPSTAWEKKQQMQQTDPVHSLKLFIAHNPPPKAIPNAGSSIFFHIWRANGSRATAGCTTMDQVKLQWLISQIDPTCKPIYILLPKADYQKYKPLWKLP